MHKFLYYVLEFIKTETKKLYNLPSDFEQTFYRDWLDVTDFSLDTDFRRNVVSQVLSEDVKIVLLATSKFGEKIQGEIDLYVTNDRLNEATFRRKLDPISTNIIRNQPKLVFQDISTFDVQNPVMVLHFEKLTLKKKMFLVKSWPKQLTLEILSYVHVLISIEILTITLTITTKTATTTTTAIIIFFTTNTTTVARST